MELRVLRYFLAVVQAGSITRAARALHVTQPTLSRQLRALEEELGQRLFLREHHPLALTPEGRLFNKRAAEIWELADKTCRDFQSMGASVAGDVFIGGGETKAMRLLAEVMKEVRRTNPGVCFRLYSGNKDDVMERLDKGTLDFALLIHPGDTSPYESLALPVRDRWGIAMRPDAPLAALPTIAPGDLAGLPLILPARQSTPQASGMRGFPEWCGEVFDALQVAATYNLIYNAAQLVEAGVGYAVTLDHLINVTGGSRLCFRPLEPRLESSLCVVWKKRQVFSPAAELFLERLRVNFSPGPGTVAGTGRG